MMDREYDDIVAEMEEEGWFEAKSDVVLDELANQIRFATPQQRHLGAPREWRDKAEHLADEVFGVVGTSVAKLDPTIRDAFIEALCVVIVDECKNLIINTVGGQQIPGMLLTVIVAFLALYIFKRVTP